MIKAFKAIIADQPASHPTSRLLGRAAAISQHLRKGFYDCVYLALAEHENCSLVTADAKLVRAARGHYPYVVDLKTLP